MEAERREWHRQQAARRAPQPERTVQPESPLTENDSGTRSSKLPASLRGWNTAGFLIGPIWGPANGVWIGIIGLLFLVIPGMAITLKLLLYLGYGAYLGFRGNDLAWRGRRWNSAEHFKRVQQQWMVAALIISVVLLLFVVPLLSN